MKMIGYQIDVARGGAGDVACLKRWLSRLAGYGYNTCMLYLEYRFQFPSLPGLGAPDSLTPAGARELDVFAKRHGVDLIPQFNCFCHNEGIASLETYGFRWRPKAEPQSIGTVEYQRYESLVGPFLTFGMNACDSFNPLAEDVLGFLKAVYSDLAACFSSPYLHVGADEIRRMKYLMPEAPKNKQHEVVFTFLNKVFQIVRDLGRTPIMWADRLNLWPEAMQWVPRDVILMDWAYGTHTRRDVFRRFRDAGYRVIVSPCTGTFNGNPTRFLPRVGYDENQDGGHEIGCGAWRNMNLIREAREEGLEGIMQTCWRNNLGSYPAFGWPIIMASAEIARGNDRCAETFWEDYPRTEWGVEDARFGEYLEIMEQRVPALFEEGKPAWMDSTVFFVLRHRLYRTHNPLPFLWELSRGVFARSRRDAARPLLDRALAIAESFSARASRNRDEPALWLAATRMAAVMLDMGDEVDILEQVYHESAVHQFHDETAFRESLGRVFASLGHMEALLEPFIRCAEDMVQEHNMACEETWWPVRAQQDLRERADGLRRLVAAGYPLIVFHRFISDLPGVPTRVMWR